MSRIGLGVWENARDLAASLCRLAQSFERIGALPVLVMRSWQSVEGQRFGDIALDPIDSPWVLGLPFTYSARRS